MPTSEQESPYDFYRRTVRACELCTARADARLPVPCAYPFGASPGNPPKVMVVGRNPGRQEDRAGEPFVGPSGRLLSVWLEHAGLAREYDVIITNLLKCYTANNRPPRAQEFATCRRYFMAELAMFTPTLVILLGSEVTKEVLGLELSKARGVFHMHEGQLYYSTYHPSFALRGPRNRNDFLADAQPVRDWWENQ